MRLTMPKFSIEFDQDIIPLMKQNEINTVFTEDKDFSPMVGDMSDNVEIRWAKLLTWGIFEGHTRHNFKMCGHFNMT